MTNFDPDPYARKSEVADQRDTLVSKNLVFSKFGSNGQPVEGSAWRKPAALLHPRTTDREKWLMTNVKIVDRNGFKVAVDQGYFWSPDMSDCPIGVKVQLLTVGGVSIYGELSHPREAMHYLRWAPLPKVPE